MNVIETLLQTKSIKMYVTSRAHLCKAKVNVRTITPSEIVRVGPMFSQETLFL